MIGHQITKIQTTTEDISVLHMSITTRFHQVRNYHSISLRCASKFAQFPEFRSCCYTHFAL